MFSPSPILRFLETKRASQVKNLPANARDLYKRCEFDPWVGKIPWRRAWQPLQYPCLEDPMDRGAWRVSVHGVARSRTQLKQVSTRAQTKNRACFRSLLSLSLDDRIHFRNVSAVLQWQCPANISLSQTFPLAFSRTFPAVCVLSPFGYLVDL